MLIERYRLNWTSNGMKWLYNLTTSWLTYNNNSWVFNNWVNAINSSLPQQLTSTSRSYSINFKLNWYNNFGWILVLDSDSTNAFTWIGTIWTSWNLRLREWLWDSIISTQNLEIWKWYNLVLTYERTTWICKCYINWNYVWLYNWTINTNLSTSTLQIWKLETWFYINANIKEVELHNTSLTIWEIKNIYMKNKWFI